MGFANEMKLVAASLDAYAHAVLEKAADIAFDSIVNGSAMTGAPGQPIAASFYEHSGTLRDSWWKARTGRDVITIGTNVGFAPAVEDNLRGAKYHNHGPHSVKLTVLAADRIFALAMQQVPRL